MDEERIMEMLDELIKTLRERNHWKARCEELEKEIYELRKKLENK